MLHSGSLFVEDQLPFRKLPHEKLVQKLGLPSRDSGAAVSRSCTPLIQKETAHALCPLSECTVAKAAASAHPVKLAALCDSRQNESLYTILQKYMVLHKHCLLNECPALKAAEHDMTAELLKSSRLAWHNGPAQGLPPLPTNASAITDPA